jgi:NTE family protein
MQRLAKLLIITLFLSVTLFTGTVSGAEEAAPERPRIGLVLGGGGAKGAAHIGVIQVLDELQIPIHCIAGTSMGALVGGTYAAGMPAAQLEKETRAIDWSQTVGSAGLRDRTPINRKLEGTGYTNSLEFGLGKGGIVVPGGLVKTQDIEDTIRDLVNDGRFKKDFDDLPIPFRAVATDMVTGDMVVLGSGDLSVAMRASMSVPGAFSPIVMGDKVLSDGGMVRNLPVDIARELCADVVIAVWLSTPQPKAEDLTTAISLIGRSMSVMIDANEKAQIATLTDNDIGISVPMGDIGTGDFQRATEAIDLGKAAAEKMRAELSRFSVPRQEYLAWRASIDAGESRAIRIADVRIEGLERVNPDYVHANLEVLKAGNEIVPEDISIDTDHLYALGDFERVDYDMSGPADARTIALHPVEKSWGPNFLRFDLGLYADLSGELEGILRGSHSTTWINGKGASWNNTLQVGRQTLGRTEFYQPLDVAQRFFVRPAVSYERNLENFYDDGDRIARYYLKNLHGELAIGANVGNRAQFVTGLRSGRIQAKKDTGAALLPDEQKGDETVAFVTALYDTRDDVGLPTRGALVYVEYMHSGSMLGGEQDYDLVEGVITKAFPWRGDSLSVILGAGGTINGELPPIHDFRLGGIRSFPGLKLDELRGDSYWFAGTSYLWKLADIQPLMGQALYAGLRLQAGRMSGQRNLNEPETLYGISGSLNGRTPVGPFMLSLGYVTDDRWELQFSLGRPLPEGSALDKIY